MAAHASGSSMQVAVPVAAHSCNEHIAAAGLLTPSSPQGRTGQDLGAAPVSASGRGISPPLQTAPALHDYSTQIHSC